MRIVRYSGRQMGAGVCPGEGGVWLGGKPSRVFAVCLGGGCTPPLWTEFLTHACENITFQQLGLRTVMTSCSVIKHLKELSINLNLSILTGLFTKPPASRFPAVP